MDLYYDQHSHFTDWEKKRKYIVCFLSGWGWTSDDENLTERGIWGRGRGVGRYQLFYLLLKCGVGVFLIIFFWIHDQGGLAPRVCWEAELRYGWTTEVWDFCIATQPERPNDLSLHSV